jgi:hypothetical protein
MRLVLDSGALIALERHDRAMWRRMKAAHLAGHEVVSHGGIVGQAWRGGGPHQTLLSGIAGTDVRPLDDRLGRAAGALGTNQGRDVIDAALVLLAGDGDHIIASILTTSSRSRWSQASLNDPRGREKSI